MSRIPTPRTGAALAAGTACLAITLAACGGSAPSSRVDQGSASSPRTADAPAATDVPAVPPVTAPDAGTSAARGVRHPGGTGTGTTTTTTTTTTSGTPAPPGTATQPAPACAPGDLAVATSTDRGGYPQGAVVATLTTVRNTSNHACAFAPRVDFTIADHNGHAVATPAHLTTDCPPAGCAPMGVGQTNSYTSRWTGLPSGLLHAEVALAGYPVSRSSEFTVLAPQAPSCRDADLAITTTTDKAAYAHAEVVKIMVSVKNTSPGSCRLAASSADFAVVDASGGQRANLGHLVFDCPPAGCSPLAPGQALTFPQQWTPGAAHGSYRVQAAFSGYAPSRSAPFVVD